MFAQFWEDFPCMDLQLHSENPWSNKLSYFVVPVYTKYYSLYILDITVMQCKNRVQMKAPTYERNLQFPFNSVS